MNETQPDFGLVSEAERKISMSGSELCRKCLAISSNLDDPRAKSGPHNPECWKHDYHEAFGELKRSCKAGCPLCQTFFFLLAYDGMVLEHTDILHWSIKRTWGLWSLSMRTDALSGAGCAWTLKDQADDSQPSQSITTIALSTSTLNEDLEALLDESINPWVEACTNSGKHHSCPSVAPHASYSYSLPTRLIDVGTDGAATVRLVDTDDISRRRNKPPYTILSYRWGSANDSAKTTSRNLKERFRRINSNNLPKTIRDAIKITQFMKIRYLWVDAVCIVQTDRTAKGEQGDDESRIDWERESTQMASYYANSLCCIAASSAKDSSDGILSERRVARYQKWYNPPNVSIRSPFASRRKFPSSLFSRGWCLQEWILSPRIIHWTANGLVWECSEGFFWEGQSGFMGEPPQNLSSGSEGRRTNDCVLELGLKESSTKYVCRILRSEKDEALGEGWTALVEHYATMDLSFLSDRDAAISGIVSVLSKRHGEDYFAGVFRSYCGQHLLWRSDPPRRSLDTSDNFPTWSWLSSKDEIRFNPIESSDCSYWMKSLGPFPSSRNGRTLTHITNKELCFTAPLIKFDMLDPGDADSKSPYYFEIGPKSPFWQGLRFTAFIDSLSSLSSLKSRAFLLILRQRLLRGTVYEGLIVQAVEVNGEARAFQDVRESYRRVGTFSIHYQQWETLPELPDLEQWMTRVVLV
ncbi:hypothetical protein FBULB1_5006 [Fusarium bulbicola]|nr:hypothetical protein FBULB1_5006 [Fusarium bulbicola]